MSKYSKIFPALSMKYVISVLVYCKQCMVVEFVMHLVFGILRLICVQE